MDSIKKVTKKALQERARKMADSIGRDPMVEVDQFPIILAALIRGHQERGIVVVEERPVLRVSA